jgi:chemotaxis protein methyltransferase CheR
VSAEAPRPPPGPPGADLPLAELERLLEQACGMALAPGVRHTVADAFGRAARERGVPAELLLRRLRAGDPAAVAALVEQAVVGETYFYRHPEQLEALARHALDRAPPGRPLVLWSAGCATGEEAYTLAMLLLEAGRGRIPDRILATDVSARALEAARAGRYGDWSLRRLGPPLRQRHFEPDGPRLSVAPAARQRVEFRTHNLVRDEAPGLGFDVVLCRNVLIYFTPERALQVLEKLAGALAPGGWLLLGPVEAPLAAPLGLEQVEAPGAMLLRRASAPARRRTAVIGTAPPTPTATQPLRPPRAERATGARSRGAPSAFEAARAAARRGDVETAERLAAEVATRDLCPEAYLLLAITAEARGDDGAAVEALRRALYLEPGLAQAHAALVPLYDRLGQPAEAARSRRNAIDALHGLDDDADLRGVEPISAGALRQALGAPGALQTPVNPGRSLR